MSKVTDQLLYSWMERSSGGVLFVCGFLSNTGISHLYGGVTMTGEGLQILTYARHLWSLNIECYSGISTDKMTLVVCFFFIKTVCSSKAINAKLLAMKPSIVTTTCIYIKRLSRVDLGWSESLVTLTCHERRINGAVLRMGPCKPRSRVITCKAR